MLDYIVMQMTTTNREKCYLMSLGIHENSSNLAGKISKFFATVIDIKP